MRTIDVTTTLAAPAAIVWSILVRGDAYQEWNPFITAVPGGLLCDAQHEFRLERLSDGATVLVQRETFRGLLVPLPGGMLEPTRCGFDAMNTAVRERAEQSLVAR